MTLGKRYQYDPVPRPVKWELKGKSLSGKTSLLAELSPVDKLTIVIDADNQFGSGLTKENAKKEIYPLSDNPADMREVARIEKKLNEVCPTLQNLGMIALDSATPIVEREITRIQNDISTGKVKGNVTAYGSKARLMKTLRDALDRWGVEVVWVYHVQETTDLDGNKKESQSVTDTELLRLNKNITVTLEVVIDNSGKRGVKVHKARRGRSNIVVWDDSGQWVNFRQKLEDAIWGGLSESEQVELENAIPSTFTSPDQAKRWALEFSEANGNFFKDAVHVGNSYDKLKAELKEQLADDLNAEIMYSSWIAKVLEKQTTE